MLVVQRKSESQATFSSDLSLELDNHVSNVCVAQHVSTGSANFDEFDSHLMASLVHAFVAARVDYCYCNLVLAGAATEMDGWFWDQGTNNSEA